MAACEPSESLRVEPMVRHDDERGVLFKVFPHPVGGEVYLITLRPGTSRGHHLHQRSGEWFAGVQGACVLVAVDPASGERHRLSLEGQHVRVPAGWAHAIFAPAGAVGLVAAAMDRPHDPDDVVPVLLETP